MAHSNIVDEEWRQLFAETEKNLKVSDAKYPCPEAGTPEFLKTIDHTLLKLDAKPSQFDDLCTEAKTYGFATVCVRPPHVKQCSTNLLNSPVSIASVIGFHEGTHPTSHKLDEISLSLLSGATELDLVLNHPQFLLGEYALVYTELAALRAAAPPPVKLKLILETSRLESRSNIIAACVLAGMAGMDFVKTSTGFDGGGAKEGDVRTMASCCEQLEGRTGRRMEVKASGGIRSLEDARGMLEAGARRLGTSNGVGIAGEAKGGTGEGTKGEGEGGY